MRRCLDASLHRVGFVVKAAGVREGFGLAGVLQLGLATAAGGSKRACCRGGGLACFRLWGV